ncbi:MAG: DNA translocase FtsK 4TM domain-containing protein [Bythopirellula sp.]|nr:DNA translocase FtsK 4TM domain-containing protein [Bythopirellula sp.]
MFENRSLRIDLFTLALLAVTALLGGSLATYDPADPPSTLVQPPRTEYQNAVGPIGAYVSHYLLESIGVGAYYFVGSLAALSVVLLLRREIDQPIVRAVGWALSLVALSTLANMLMPNSTPGPEIGPGGFLGAMGRALLESHFATAGAYILSLSVLLAGWLLCTDYFLFRVAAVTTVASSRGIATLGHMSHTLKPKPTSKKRPATDVENGIDDGEPPVSKNSEAGGEEYEDEEADDDEWEYEYEDEEETGEEASEEAAAELTVRTPATKQEAGAQDQVGEPALAGGDDEEAEASPLKEKLTTALGLGKGKKLLKKSEREEVISQLEAAEQRQPESGFDYELPPLDLLLEPENVSYEEHEKEVRRKARILEKTFKNFGFNVKVVEIETGPVIAQYEVQLEAGLRLAKITNLADDLAIALRVPSVRIVAPIPGKNTVGIEVPNEHRQLVRLREVIEESNGHARRMKIPIYLGKDVSGNPLVVDLTTLPHLLIAGRTGTGKSVCLNSIILSMLMSRGPDEVRMLMIDPKMVELSGYRKLPHLMHPVVTDMKKAEAILSWAVDKMEERYALLARAGVRHITVFNQLSDEELRERIDPTSEAEWETIPKQLPFIVIVADEIADLMMTAGKDVEQHIIRLAQKSRAVGIHLILATQKPTVDVITGLIKSNLPARIAFQVASRTDSRVVLDEMGADKLLGNGDMLFLSPGTSQLLRGQGTYLSDDEITRVVDFVGTDAPQFAKELIELKTKDEDEVLEPGQLKNRDELYEAAVDIVVRERRGSVSLLQRCLGIGYGRAARLIDFMAEDGIVGEYNGSQAREVAISIEDWEAMQSGSASAAEAAAPPKPRRINKVLPGTDEPSDIEETDHFEEETAEDPSDLEYEIEDEAKGEPASAGGDADTDDNDEEEYEYEEESDAEEDEDEEESDDEDLWEDESEEEDDNLAETA